MSYSTVPMSMYDETFLRLSPEEQRMEWFIRHCPTRATEGLFRFKFGAIEDTIGIDRVTAETALEELIKAGRPFMYDKDAGVILDLDALKTAGLGADTPRHWRDSDPRIRGAMSRLKSLPKTRLLNVLYANAVLIAPQLAAAMREEFDLPETDTDGYAELQHSLEAASQVAAPAAKEGASRGEQKGGEESVGSGSRFEDKPLTDVIETIRTTLDAEVIEER